jgi:hypothetical protein
MAEEHRPRKLKDVPPVGEIQVALQALCTEPRGWKIRDNMLMGFVRAQEHMPAKSSRSDDFSDGVRTYLDEAVLRVGQQHHRVILEVVLGLGEEKWRDKDWRQLSAEKRREEAGRLFRGEDGVVKAGTIRQLYEPKAREELAAIIWRDEKRARGESPGDS